MAQSIVGCNYDSAVGSASATAVNTSTFVVAQGSPTLDANAVGCAVGTNLSIRNTSGSSQVIDGLVFIGFEAGTSVDNLLVAMGTSSDDSSYTVIDAGDQSNYRMEAQYSCLVLLYSATVASNDYIAPMLKGVTVTQNVNINAHAHLVRTRDGGNPTKIMADSFTQRETNETETFAVADTYYQYTTTATDEITVGATGNNDLSFDVTADATIDGMFCIFGRASNATTCQFVGAGGKDTGSGYSVVTDTMGSMVEINNTDIRLMAGWYSTDVSSGDSVAPMIKNRTNNTTNFDHWAAIHQIRSRT